MLGLRGRGGALGRAEEGNRSRPTILLFVFSPLSSNDHPLSTSVPSSISKLHPRNKKNSLSTEQAALASRISAEGAQTVLDLRGRLGPQAGQRKGKRLDWRSSETRLAGLLEGLCDSESLDADFAVRKKEKTVGLSVISKDDDDDEDDEDEDEDAGEGSSSSREVLWLRRGERDETEDASLKGFVRVTEAREKDSRSKQLGAWCGRLVSEVEEGLARELAGGSGSGSVSEAGSGKQSGDGDGNGDGNGNAPLFDARGALCERLTRSCAPTRKEESEERAASPDSKKQKRSWRGKRQQQQREEL